MPPPVPQLQEGETRIEETGTQFISFAKSKGLYAGLNLEGSSVNVRDKLNKAYYGKETTPVDIVVKKDVSSKGSAALLAALSKATK